MNTDMIKLKLLGEGNFGLVFGCDLCVLKVYKDIQYLEKIKQCSLHISNYGLQASIFSFGYITQNVLTDRPSKNWFEVWVENANKGVFHCDLKSDNVLNSALIDLDNYFFQAAGHIEWVMSDSRYYSKALLERGLLFADWQNIKNIAQYEPEIILWADTWDFYCLKANVLSENILFKLDNIFESGWRELNQEFVGSTNAGIYKLNILKLKGHLLPRRHEFSLNNFRLFEFNKEVLVC